MFTMKNSQKDSLPDIAACHIACFPTSLSTQLGHAYVQKTFEWFLVGTNRFLFHVSDNNKVIGYCGGFMPLRAGDGSSSGMLQYAFREAVRGVIKNPLLLFHPEVAANYRFLWLNIKRRITGKAKAVNPVSDQKPFKQYTGLVVIGVHPDCRGRGLAQQLMTEFEIRTRAFHQSEMVLSVKKGNERAVKAYTNFGWKIREEHSKTFVMHKFV